MELGSDQHPDPVRDAMQDLVYRAVQVGSFAVTGIQVYGYHRRAQARIAAEQDHRARRALNAQIRAERDADRARWQPALDPGWLRRAHILEAAEAWGAALPYTDRSVPWYDPAAANAMTRCEERLRSLHLYAMARYDRLRGDGFSPAEAMRETAPLFARHPYARDAPSVPRQMLEATAPGQTDGPAAGASPGPVPANGTRTGRVLRPCDEDFPIPIRDVLSAQARTTASSVTEAPATRAVPHPSQRDRRT